MSEPRWHDADPRPPYGGVPGPELRSARNTPGSAGRPIHPPRGSDRPAAWEEPGWYREDSDPFSSVPMATGPRQAENPRPAEGSRQAEADGRPPGRRADRRRAGPDPRPAPSWRWGELSGGRGMLVVLAAAVLGAIATVVAKRDPGSPLGWFIVAGTLIAGLAVRPRSAYLLIPVPALAYVVFGLAAGLIRHQSDPSSTGLAVSAAQWVANGFLTMAAATVLASVIALGRWYLDHRAAASPAGRRRAGSGGRPPEERLDRAERARSVPSDSSGLLGQSDQMGFGGQRGRSGQSNRDGVDPGRPKPAFHPHSDWPGDRGAAGDPRDRRPPPGPARRPSAAGPRTPRSPCRSR